MRVPAIFCKSCGETSNLISVSVSITQSRQKNLNPPAKVKVAVLYASSIYRSSDHECFVTSAPVRKTKSEARRATQLVTKERIACVNVPMLPVKTDGPPNRGNTAMSKKAAEHHKQSAEHHTHASRHHGEAAKHHESGNHEKAAHHAHTARGHALHARHHSDEAAKSHMEDHGKK